MLRHIVVFIYILSSFLGMTVILLYWLLSKKQSLKDAAEFTRLRKFMISTFLIGLISFFTFYGQYIIFRQPDSTVFRILDYLFWACFIFYWIDYLDSMVDSILLRKLKKAVKYGCLGYIIIWIFSTAQIWDIDFVITSQSSRILFVILDILFCLLSILVVIIYVIRGQKQVESRLSGFYIFAVSTALSIYAAWEFLHYITLFTDSSTPKAWELNPLNATAFFLLFTNLITLVYVYHNDFASSELNHPSEMADIRPTIPKQEDQAAAASTDVITEIDTETVIESVTESIAIEHNLTPREVEIMEFVCKGFNNAEIAVELYISQNTVKHHIYNLFRKLNVSSRVELLCMLQAHYS